MDPRSKVQAQRMQKMAWRLCKCLKIKGSLKGYFGRPERAELIRIKQKAAEQFCKTLGLSYRITVGKEIPKKYHTLARRLHGQNYSQNT